ncbi:MAG: monoheme cytochrome C [Flavobacteriales bacterium]|nr:monoheme cytochrome C [Flavobacteriales bacterium]
MIDSNRQKILDEIQRHIKALTRGIYALVIGVATLIYYLLNPSILNVDVQSKESVVVAEAPLPEYENGIHLATGFKEGENLNLVIANCTSCHSAKMVTQNRATRDGWKTMIKWMQETQNLWELGESEPLILDYLAKYYAPEKAGRRQPLTDIDWYELED